MPFSHVRDEFQPEELAKLTEAFNLAWPEVLLARGASTQPQLGWCWEQRHSLRNLLPRPFLAVKRLIS